LYLSLQSQPSTADYIKVTVKFVLTSNTNTLAGVNINSTNIFDIDANNTATNYFTDQISNIYAVTLASGTVGITTASIGGTSGTDNILTGGTGLSTVVTGTGANGGGSGANNDLLNTGNFNFGFGAQTVTQFSFRWYDVNPNGQAIQRITLDNINFTYTATPEVNPGMAAALACVGVVVFRKLRRSRRP